MMELTPVPRSISVFVKVRSLYFLGSSELKMQNQSEKIIES
ncbi:hypothetical protein CKA32_005696 [Geitlerinema sp. FC II]|nr:hypothetical protein CKA32_005696 [Geitlerinema sp. FC II]